MKGVSIVIGTMIMVMIMITLAGGAFLYTQSMITAKNQGIEVEGTSCDANPVLRTDVNQDGWVEQDDVDEVFANRCDPPGCIPPCNPCAQWQLEKYDINYDNQVAIADWTQTALDIPKLSGGHAYIRVTNIGTDPINVTRINIVRTLPTSGPVSRIEWDVDDLMLMPGETVTAELICPGEEGASCEYRLSPPTGKSVTAVVYCI